MAKKNEILIRIYELKVEHLKNVGVVYGINSTMYQQATIEMQEAYKKIKLSFLHKMFNLFYKLSWLTKNKAY